MNLHKLHIIVDTRATEILETDQNGVVLGRQYFAPGGVEFCEFVKAHLKNEYQFLIARLSAEMIILTVGSVLPGNDKSMSQKGRDLVSGLPGKREISTTMIQEPIDQILNPLIDSVARLLTRKISARLPDTTFEHEFTLSGEYSRLKGLDRRFEEAIRANGIPDAIVVIKEPTLNYTNSETPPPAPTPNSGRGE